MLMEKIPSRSNWIVGRDYSDILEDLNGLTETYIGYMFSRTSRIFAYDDLPNYIPIRDVERILQTFGFIYFKKIDGLIYGLYGGLGGIPNAYYQSTKLQLANPYLRYYDSVEIDSEDGVLIWNDSAHIGLNALNNRYAKMMAHCDISIKWGLVNSRIPSIFVVKNDNDVEAIKDFFDDVENGTLKGIFNTDSLLYENGIEIKSFQNNQTNALTSLIETRQYYYASWLNELGIQANYNMKREAINGAESGMNEEALKPLVDDMLLCRKEGFEKFNEVFGTNVVVHYNSSWVERKSVGEDAQVDIEDKKSESEEEPNE